MAGLAGAARGHGGRRRGVAPVRAQDAARAGARLGAGGPGKVPEQGAVATARPWPERGVLAVVGGEAPAGRSAGQGAAAGGRGLWSGGPGDERRGRGQAPSGDQHAGAARRSVGRCRGWGERREEGRPCVRVAAASGAAERGEVRARAGQGAGRNGRRQARHSRAWRGGVAVAEPHGHDPDALVAAVARTSREASGTVY
nr:spidroin-1-like [Aegilops tauschii subsp. strangulata]